MAIIIIMAFVILVLWGTLAAGYRGSATENGNYVLGIFLSGVHREDPETLEILLSYKRKTRPIHIAGFAGGVLLLLINGFVSLLFAGMTVWYGLLLFFYHRNVARHAGLLYQLKLRREWFVSADEEEKDRFWLEGFPPGRRPGTLEPKRFGTALTSNNSLKATAAEKGVLIFTACFVLGICLYLAPFDFGRVSMEIDEGTGRCRIEASYSMGHSFSLDEIEDIAFVEEKPHMSKRSGYDSNRFWLGDFRVSGYESSKVYLWAKNDSAIQVILPGKDVWFNGKTREETFSFYEKLTAAYSVSSGAD